MKKTLGKSILVLSIIGSISTIFIFGYLYWFTLKYFRANFPLGYPTETISFYVAMFVAITTVIFQWVDGRIKSIVDSFKQLKRIKLEGGVINGQRRSSRSRSKVRS